MESFGQPNTMTMVASLDLDIRSPHLADETKCAILNTIWGSSYTTEHLNQNEILGSSYMRYYDEQCRNALQSKGLDTFIKTHADITDVIQELKDTNATRQQVISSLRSKLQNQSQNGSDASICEAIDLAVRLWLMVDIGELLHSFVPTQKSLVWKDGTLENLLEDRFGMPAAIPMRIVRVKLDRIFTARNLQRIAGLQIIWTDNHSDHLRLMADDRWIAIYHHVSVLEHHKSNQVFPPGFIDETLRTISLLFPQYDPKSCKWIKSQQTQFGLDRRISEAGQLTTEERQIENFTFWHDRIGILKQVFDEAEPRTIAQWWCDRRRQVQWYTFWTAVIVVMLTVLFGVVQCIEGGLQVYKAYHPS